MNRAHRIIASNATDVKIVEIFSAILLHCGLTYYHHVHVALFEKGKKTAYLSFQNKQETYKCTI